MPKWRLPRVLAATLFLAIGLLGKARAESVEDFYRGRQINMIIATNPGSGYDIYARLLIAHMGRHIPGSPTFVPRNLIGAGGLRTGEYIYRIAPKDGSHIGTYTRGLPFEPLLGQNELNMDPLQFTWLGSMNRETSVAFSWGTSAVRHVSDLRLRELLTPGTGAGADSEIMPLAFNNLTGTKFRVIKGYKGTAEATLAVERGELDGIAYWSYGALNTVHRHWIEGRKINFLFHTGAGELTFLPGVPSIYSLVRNETDRQALDFILAREALGRPFFTSPGIPLDRADALRKAFSAAMRDPALIADAQARQLDIGLVTGQQIEDILQQASKAPPHVLARVKEALER